MAKIADYKYPGELGPNEAEDWMNVLVNDFGGRAESDESFAQSVGHRSATSGTFRRKIADARKYGLMTPRGTFESTNLGFQLANPENDRERQKAYLQMLRNIPLLVDIHDAISGNIPDEFWRVLTEQTNANPKEARETAPVIEELYDALVRAEERVEESATRAAPGDEKSTEEPSVEASIGSQADSALYVKVGNDELRFDELNDTNLRLVRDFLGSKMESVEDEELRQTKLNE